MKTLQTLLNIQTTRLALASLLVSVGSSFCQCPVAIQNLSTGASLQKYGWTGCGTLDSPPRIFLVNSIVYGVNGGLSTDSYEVKCSTTEVHIQTINPTNGAQTEFYAGSDYWSYSDNTGYSTSIAGLITNSVTGKGDDNWDLAQGNGATLKGEIMDGLSLGGSLAHIYLCTPELQGDIYSGSYISPGPGSVSYNLSDNHFDYALSTENDDSKLRKNTILLMPPYPPDYVTNWAAGSGTALYSLTSDHKQDTCQKMKYQFYVCDSSNIQNVQYRIDWQEVTTYPDGCASDHIVRGI